MAISTIEKLIDGIWGPYYEAMVTVEWLTKAGQSASGILIVHIIIKLIIGSMKELEKKIEVQFTILESLF